MNKPATGVLYKATSLETAACIWECVLDIEMDYTIALPNPAQEETGALIRKCREINGTWGLRVTALGWVDAIDAAWDLVDAPDGEHGQFCGAFDWEFIPDWIMANVQWDQDGRLPTVRKIVCLPAIQGRVS